ncbi:MAG: YbjN domain-containing protein [Verrucomicrobia bacterium]|nr:YbjN domain-containing protein [Verrucomicrobiota bacterium]
MNKSLSLVVGCVCALSLALWAYAANVSGSVEMPAPAVLQSSFEAAGLACRADKDAAFVISDDGIDTYVQIDTDNRLLTYYSVWRLKKDAPELRTLQYVNRLNDQSLLVRFCIPQPNTLWCDYQFKVADGAAAAHLLDNYRTYVAVVRDAVGAQDAEGLVSEE